MRSLALLFVLLSGAAFGQTYPWLPPALSGTFYSYNLPTAKLILGTPALTVDLGMLYWNGTTWQTTIVSTALTSIEANSFLCNPNNYVALPVACTTLPSTVTTPYWNGTYAPVNSAANQIPVTTASQTAAWETMPECVDSGGNHLNYDNTTQTISCGNTSSGGGTTTVTFSNVTGGANAGNALTIANGSSLSPTGTGTISATSLQPGAIAINPSGSNSNTVSINAGASNSGNVSIDSGATNSGTLSIGSNGGTQNTVIQGIPVAINASAGNTNINAGTSNTGNVSINTGASSTGTVSIGNNANTGTTAIQGATVTINASAGATNINAGASN